MNKLTKYEEMLVERLKELPLPDEDAAWQDMSRRLDKGNSRPVFFLRFRNGCGIGALLIALFFIGLFWFYVKDDKHKNPSIEGASKERGISANKDLVLPETIGSRQKTSAVNDSNLMVKQFTRDSLPGAKLPTASNKPGDKKYIITIPDNQPLIKTKENYAKKKKRYYNSAGKAAITIKKEAEEMIPAAKDDIDSTIKLSYTKPDHQVPINELDNVDPGNSMHGQKDSITPVLKKADSTVQPGNKKIKKSKEAATIFYSAGLAVWQKIDNIGPKPLAAIDAGGTGGSGNNATQKNNKLFDYIPSVYARMSKGNNWFLQAEFRYRAPQYERNLLYSEKGIPGPFGNARATKIVTKTYYHQVPLSFNYFVIPGFSIGGGVIWNKFSRAVTMEEVRTTIPGFPQQDTVLSASFSEVTKADTNFTRYYFHGMIEAQYRWRKFSLGVRYAAALQPYLKFTLPGGMEQKERNSSLQLFIRYEWWKSKKVPAKK